MRISRRASFGEDLGLDGNVLFFLLIIQFMSCVSQKSVVQNSYTNTFMYNEGNGTFMLLLTSLLNLYRVF